MLGHRYSDKTLQWLNQSSITPVAGDTPLHHAVRHCKSLDDIHALINEMGEKSISMMAKTVNDRGQIPVYLVYESSLNMADMSKLFALLLSFTANYVGLSLAEMIDTDEVLQRYQQSASEQLNENLMIACWVVNQVRSVIKKSYTHPEYHDYPQEVKIEVQSAIEDIRRDDPTSAYHYYLDSGKYYDAGNCQEYSYLGLHFLMNRHKPIYAEIMKIEYGDHVIIVMDRKLSSDVKDYPSWGSTAVVIDAWKGDVYPAYDIPERLGTYQVLQKDGLQYNIVTSFNPNYHYLWLAETAKKSLTKRFFTPDTICYGSSLAFGFCVFAAIATHVISVVYSEQPTIR